MKFAGRTVLGKIGLSRFLQWRINTFLMRWAPLTLTRCYLNMLGTLYYCLNSGERKLIEKHIGGVLQPGTSPHELTTLIGRTFRGIFAHYHEKLFMAYSAFKQTCRFLNERVALDGAKLLDEALAQGRGVILVTGHYGAVEFLPLTLALKGYPVTMLLRFKTERLKKMLQDRAENVPITLVDVDEEENVVFTALKALRSNQILITECDEFECWKPHRSESTRFLGATVRLDRSLDMLHGRSKAPILMGLVSRREGGRYRLKLQTLDPGRHNEKPLAIARQALAILEQYIYQAPDQWYQWKEAGLILQPFAHLPVAETRDHHTYRGHPFDNTPARVSPA